MAIDTSGLFPEKDAKIFEDFGAQLKERAERKIASTKGKGNTINLTLSSPTLINEIEIQENIKKGERIRKYKVDAFVDGKWLTVCEGSSVGHKRIQSISPVLTSELKITIIESILNPLIKCFSAYSEK
ncbi:MAG: hypothetical protein ACK5AO_06970, partial [bacterium]